MTTADDAYREPFASAPLPDALRAAAVRNEAYRAVIYTTPPSAGGLTARIQQVLMSIGYTSHSGGDSIGWEVHERAAQTFSVASGFGILYIGRSSERAKAMRVLLEPGDSWSVDAGTYHEITGRLKLVTTYCPPVHAPHTLHRSEKEARAACEDYVPLSSLE